MYKSTRYYPCLEGGGDSLASQTKPPPVHVDHFWYQKRYVLQIIWTGLRWFVQESTRGEGELGVESTWEKEERGGVYMGGG